MKQKIFDIIFFFNEVEILNKRIEYLNSSVTKFIVLNFGPLHLNPIQDNIEVYKLKFQRAPFFRNNFLEYLFYTINFEDVSYDDFFIFSKVDEIPDLENLFKSVNPKDFVPLILNHQNYAWSHHMKSKTDYYGSRVFQFTNFLQNTVLHKQLYNSNPLMWKAKIEDNGYKLFGFQKLEELNESKNFWYHDTELAKTNMVELFNHQNSINHEDKITHHYYSEESTLPILFWDLSHQVSRPNKISVLFDLTSSNDEIKYSFENKEFSLEILYPPKVLYGEKNYDDFKEDFRKNEILRLLKKLPIDIIDRVEIKKTTETVVFDINKILDSVPSELF